jgi:hypothetical protein
VQKEISPPARHLIIKDVTAAANSTPGVMDWFGKHGKGSYYFFFFKTLFAFPSVAFDSLSFIAVTQGSCAWLSHEESCWTRGPKITDGAGGKGVVDTIGEARPIVCSIYSLIPVTRDPIRRTFRDVTVTLRRG